MTKKTSSAKAGKHGANKTPWLWVAIGAVALIGMIVVLAVVLSRPAAAVPLEITVTQAYEKYQKGTFFLDVRTTDEWVNDGHIPNTTLIPLDELPNRLGELSKDQEIVVVCRSGNRSQQGRDILRQAGFTNVTSMAGGVKGWKAAGYSLVTGP
jgi:rhodanese-related sulfurtransferase